MTIYKCDQCFIGARQPKKATFTRWEGEELIVVPDAVGWVCDVCGDSIIDPAYDELLDALLGSAALTSRLSHFHRKSLNTTCFFPLIVSRRRSV